MQVGLRRLEDPPQLLIVGLHHVRQLTGLLHARRPRLHRRLRERMHAVRSCAGRAVLGPQRLPRRQREDRQGPRSGGPSLRLLQRRTASAAARMRRLLARVCRNQFLQELSLAWRGLGRPRAGTADAVQICQVRHEQVALQLCLLRGRHLWQQASLLW